MENTKKNNSILIRLSEDELRQLNDGWFLYVREFGKPVSKNEYIRACIRGMLNVLTEMQKEGLYNGEQTTTGEGV